MKITGCKKKEPKTHCEKVTLDKRLGKNGLFGHLLSGPP